MDLQWLQSDEAENISEDAKAKAWKDFKIKYPFADISKFVAQTDFINKKHATAEIYLKAGPGFWQTVSGSDRKYWYDQMKSDLQASEDFRLNSLSIIILQILFRRFNLRKTPKLLEVCSIRK